jgi:glycosyltransferase involved in cell wall biosynthesis
VVVVRSGPSLERMQRVAPVEAHKGGRRFLVAYVGVMGAQEGIEYLLEAARHIVFDLRRSDVAFRLVGDGTDRARLERLAQEMGLGDAVAFMGRVSDQVLLEVLNTADVCVNPDEYNEMNDKSTMNKIMEYMSLAKPIVQFDLTEGRYSAREASLYARRNDARDFAGRIVELLDDPERRARMGELGRRRVVEELSWDHEAPRLLGAYASLWQG